ncbi:MAG: glycerol kinase GlpK, partial [Myxococcales bacterium]|nr:glycerol kinase GlpK [Myxococcales bacterium]
MKNRILTIDQGTTGTTVLLIDAELTVEARVTLEFPQIYPRSGWVEHDPETIWDSVVRAIGAVLDEASADPATIAAIGITNQRETTVLWDRETGRPVHNAIVWQCRRTAELCRALRDQGLNRLFAERTGLVLDPYFSGTKVRWLLDNVAGARLRAESGELAFGTIDSWLVWKLSGGARHVTDVTNASRTLMLDLKSRRFDDELLEHLGVPRALLPEVLDCAGLFGETKGVPGLPDGIPISGIAGDQQAALFGQCCFHAGDAKITYGTGAFLLMNTGERPVVSEHGLLTTVAWQLDGKPTYALEGSVFIAGAAIQWLRDGLELFTHASQSEALARSVEDAGGVIFVPALTGLGAPHWSEEARGAVLGISRGTTKAH